KNTTGEGSQEHGDSMINLASLYRAKNDIKQAKLLLGEAYELTVKRVGKETHPDCARIANQAGILLFQQKDYETAEKAFFDAHKIWKQTLGAQHADTRTAAANLLAVYERQLEPLRKQAPAGKLPDDADGLFA